MLLPIVKLEVIETVTDFRLYYEDEDTTPVLKGRSFKLISGLVLAMVLIWVLKYSQK